MSRFYGTTPDGTSIPFPDDAPVVEVDVREDLRTGREPFSRIMGAVQKLGFAEVLRVRATFAPVPLIELLSEQGFVYHLESADGRGLVRVVLAAHIRPHVDHVVRVAASRRAAASFLIFTLEEFPPCRLPKRNSMFA